MSLGFLFLAGAVFVLLAFVLPLPGTNPGDVGVVMALLPMVGLGAPLVGGMLDRFGSFLLFQHLGLGLFAAGFGVLALADEVIGASLGAFILGPGAACLVTANTSIMAGSGLPEEELASRTSMLHMSVPIGQFTGLLTLAMLLELNVDFSDVFFIFGLLSLLALAAAAATNGAPVARALRHQAAARLQREDVVDSSETMGLGALLLSGFGLALLVAFFAVGAVTTIDRRPMLRRSANGWAPR